MIDGFGDWARVGIGLSSAVVATLISFRILRVWHYFHWTQKAVFFSLLLYTMGIAGRAFELLRAENEPFSYWFLAYGTANAIMIVYLWEPRESYGKRLGQDIRFPKKPSNPLK